MDRALTVRLFGYVRRDRDFCSKYERTSRLIGILAAQTISGKTIQVFCKPLSDQEYRPVSWMARKLITEFGDRAHIVTRKEADRFFKADASVEAKKWLELANAVARITSARGESGCAQRVRDCARPLI